MKISILKNYQFIAALLLLLFIPTSLLIYNSFFINKFRTLMNNELINKASLSLDTIINGRCLSLTNPVAAQSVIHQIISETNKNQSIPSFQALDLLVPDKNGFKITASLDPKNVGQIIDDQYYHLAWDNNFIAFNTGSGSNSADQTLTPEDKQNDWRFTTAVKVVRDSAENKIGLLALKIPAREVDDYLSGIVSWSNLILAAIILIILISILANSRLFKYVYKFEDLKASDKLKDEFISIGSHELRAPLLLIKGNADLAAAALDKNDIKKSHEFLGEITTSTKRLSDLVEDMLEVSRIEQGRMKFNFKVIEPLPLIKEVLSQFQDQANAKKLTLTLAKPGAAIAASKINVDSDRFKQILVNLISNAIKYTLTGGLTITLNQNRQNLIMKFKDTGVGMNAKKREKLFQKFYRVEETQTREVTGTGLGLWITKMITEAMKGEIMVDSIEGVGTEFTLTFPLTA